MDVLPRRFRDAIENATEKDPPVFLIRPDSHLFAFDLRVEYPWKYEDVKKTYSMGPSRGFLVYGIRKQTAYSNALWTYLTKEDLGTVPFVIFARVADFDPEPIPDWVFDELPAVKRLYLASQNIQSTKALAKWLVRWDTTPVTIHLEGNYGILFKDWVVLVQAARMRKHRVVFHVDALQMPVGGSLTNYAALMQSVTFVREGWNPRPLRNSTVTENYCWDLVPEGLFPEGVAKVSAFNGKLEVLTEGEYDTIVVEFGQGTRKKRLLEKDAVRSVHIRGKIPPNADFSFLKGRKIAELTIDGAFATDEILESIVDQLEDETLERFAVRNAKRELTIPRAIAHKFKPYSTYRNWFLDVTGSTVIFEKDLLDALRDKRVRVVTHDDYDSLQICADCGGLEMPADWDDDPYPDLNFFVKMIDKEEAAMTEEEEEEEIDEEVAQMLLPPESPEGVTMEVVNEEEEDLFPGITKAVLPPLP